MAATGSILFHVHYAEIQRPAFTYLLIHALNVRRMEKHYDKYKWSPFFIMFTFFTQVCLGMKYGRSDEVATGSKHMHSALEFKWFCVEAP